VRTPTVDDDFEGDSQTMTENVAGRQSAPTRSAVDFGDLRRVTPVAGNFGFERGRPVDRYYIERFLEQQSSTIAGRVLEIGDSAYTRQFGGDKVTRSDVLHVSGDMPGVTIVADLADAPHLAEGTFDCVICTQTLQFVYEVRSAVRTLHRILAPGGVLLATFPGISQTDDRTWESSWYWNFTSVSARRLFGDVFGPSNTDVAAFGNVLTAICFLQGIVTEELRPEELDHIDPSYPVLITVLARKRATHSNR